MPHVQLVATHTHERFKKITMLPSALFLATLGASLYRVRVRGWQHPETQYLALVKEIIQYGERRDDRTGTGTLSLFGRTMRFSLRGGVIPLLTTKRVFWRGIVHELFWFIRGQTDANILAREGVRIWEGNTSREFLDKRGLQHYREGDAGCVYGFQFRHYGAEYVDCRTDYTGKGVDQLAEVIRQIKTDPFSRRIILSAWNPQALHEMVLPPCHVLSQFYVSSAGELSCQLYQRSGDMGLGVPFNIASYALLTHLLAHVSGLKPGELVIVLGDAHVYTNHVEPLQTQLARTPRPFPTVEITNATRDIDNLGPEDVVLHGYDPQDSIAMKMAV